MADRSRREMLAALIGGVVTLSGCSGFGDDSGGSEPRGETPTAESGGTGGSDTPTETPQSGDPTPTETESEQSQLAAVERASAWPNRRGPPSNTGTSATGGPGPDAAATFSAELRNGQTVSNRAPVVGPDAIYAIAGPATPYDQSPPEFACYAYALSREDGSELWRQTLESGEGEENNDLPRDTSLCLGPDGLYAVWARGGDTFPVRIARLSRADGSEQWRTTVEPTAGNALQPVVRDRRLYQQFGRRVVVFDTADGSELWRTSELLVDQAVVTVGPDSLLLYHVTPDRESTHALTAFDTADQTVRWTEPYSESRRPIPAIDGETVYLADGGSHGMTRIGEAMSDDPTTRPRRQIHALSLADGSERWSHTYDTDAIHESVTAGGTSYLTVADESVYYALGFPSAEELVGPNASAAALESLRERLYRGPNVVALDRSDGSVVWRTKVGSQAQVFQPMVAGPESLYALYRGVEADDEQPQVYVIDRATGDVRGSFGPVDTAQPFAVADGAVYTNRRGDVRAWE